MRQRLKIEQRLLNRQGRHADRASGRHRKRGVGVVVTTMQARASKLEALFGRLLDDGVAIHGVVGASAANFEHFSATAAGLSATFVIALRDQRDVALGLADESVALGVGVVLKRRVTIEVVFGNVEQDADFGLEAVRALQLKARALQEGGVEAAPADRLRSGRSQVAADERTHAGFFQDVAQERGGGALAVRAADEQ